jgi:hypothetical protein
VVTLAPVMELRGVAFAAVGLPHMLNAGGAVLRCTLACGAPAAAGALAAAAAPRQLALAAMARGDGAALLGGGAASANGDAAPAAGFSADGPSAGGNGAANGAGSAPAGVHAEVRCWQGCRWGARSPLKHNMQRRLFHARRFMLDAGHPSLTDLPHCWAVY